MEYSSIEPQETATETSKEKKKPGPAKGQAKQIENNLKSLTTRIESLEALVLRMAHQSGTSHAIIRESGLAPFNPQHKDMTKFKVG